jgi:hypothetical protein
MFDNKHRAKRPQIPDTTVWDVRFGSKADIPRCPRYVRFAPESGCPLWAKSGHTTKKKGRRFGRPIKSLSVKSVHTELAHRHHKVMRLVVSALNHDAHKAERL